MDGQEIDTKNSFHEASLAEHRSGFCESLG